MMTNTYNTLNKMVALIGEWKESIANNSMDTEDLNNMVETMHNFPMWVRDAHEKDKIRPLADILRDIGMEAHECISQSDYDTLFEMLTDVELRTSVDSVFDYPSELLDYLRDGYADADDLYYADYLSKDCYGDVQILTEDDIEERIFDNIEELIDKCRDELEEDASDDLRELLAEYDRAKESEVK